MRKLKLIGLSILLAACSQSGKATGSSSADDSEPTRTEAKEVRRERPTLAPPPYADHNRFEEREVVVNPGKWALPGTLSIPRARDPVPAVIIVHGSGPTDRDGTFVSQKRYRDIAWGLASRGIAVLRYDKRTLTHGKKMTALLTVKEESVDDAIAAAELLRTIGSVDKSQIYILGHSLGGTLTPRILARDRTLAGGIVLAGAARPLEDIVFEQQMQMFEAQRDRLPTEADKRAALVKMLDAGIAELRGTLDKVKALRADDKGKPARLFGAAAAYWLDLRDYRPATVAAQLSVPLLLLQAGRDLQVPAKDFELWKQELSSKSDASFRLYPSLNHLFIFDHGGGLKEYGRPGAFVHKAVIEDVAAWIGEQGP